MQATWSDIDSEESGSTTSNDARYDPNDFLTFIASMESMHDSDCDCDSDDVFIDDKKSTFLNNVIVEHKN